jgi:tRNA pseudouridine32 synthase/23S rRNA pseudouridine746 synthase
MCESSPGALRRRAPYRPSLPARLNLKDLRHVPQILRRSRQICYSRAMLNPMPATFDYRPPTEPWLTSSTPTTTSSSSTSRAACSRCPARTPRSPIASRPGSRRAGRPAKVVHRLDKDTSGILLMASTRRRSARLGSQFEHRKTTKFYVARVWGEVEGEQRHRRPAARHRLGEQAAPARRSRARPRQPTDGKCWPRTARHADEARAAHRPHAPAARPHDDARATPSSATVLRHGDALAAADRLQLHAAELGFTHPDGTPMPRFG